MATLQCKSCGGVYDDVQRDGIRYFHACAPVTRVAVERAGSPTVVDLKDVKPDDTITVTRSGATTKTTVSTAQAGDARLGDTIVERPNKRDENVTGPPAKPGDPAPIKSPGAGTTPGVKGG